MIKMSSFHTRWTPWPGVLLLTGVIIGASAGALAPPDARAQAPVATPDQPQLQPALPLEGPTAMVFHTVKADRMVEFEALFTRLREAFALSGEAARRSQAAGWRIFKQNAPTAQGHLLYVSVIDPVVPGQEYDIARLLAEAFPAEGAALYQSLLASHVQPTVQASNLTLVTSLAPVAPVTPAPPPVEEPPS
jgi:hypothetical protein